MSAWPFDPLRPLSFGAIIADPPWQYEMRSEEGYEKSPEAHYDTMPEEEIAALPVGELASGSCLLWLWSTWPHLPQALRVMAAWGFTYKTGGSWTKTTATGKRAFGTGYLLRSTTEPFLIGTIGTPKIRSKSVRNLIESERREHSRKPPEARAMVEKLLPEAFACELFAREPWPGNQVWGKEKAKFALLAQNVERPRQIGRSRTIGAPLVGAPVAALSRDPAVDLECMDRQFALFGQELGTDGAQLGPVDIDPADLRRDRKSADRLDDRVAVARTNASGCDEEAGDGDHGAHDHEYSGAGL